MIPQLASALTGGYTTKQIMQFLIRQFPQHSDKIKGALKAGFTADQVVKFLGGGRKAVNQESEGITEHEQTRNKDIQRRENVNQGALKGAGMAAMAGGTALAAPMLQSALQRASPQLFGPGSITSSSNTGLGPSSGNIGSPSPIPAAQIPQANLISPSSSQPPISPTLPQQAQPVQPEVKPINVNEILSKYPGFEKKMADMIQSKNTPEVIAQYFKHLHASQTKKLEKESGQPIENIISEYMQSKPEDVKPLDIEQKIPEIEKVEAEPLKIEKGSTVASPQGVGEIKEIRNGKAIIEVDGKKHQVDEDELESEPQDLEPAVRHILNSIPEKMKSTAFESTIHINLPSEEEGSPGKDIMLVKFYNGKWGWYLDVPENLYSDIAMGVYDPKTSGKTGIAEYKPGVIDSRGAGFQEELVQNPKYAKDKKDKTWGYATTKYNALEMIQELVNKISKEKYDENGNLIQTKKRKKRN